MARTMHYVLLRIVFKLIIPFGSVVVLIICYTLLAITMLMNIRAAHGNVGVAPPTVPGPSVDSSVTTNGTATVDVTSSKNSSVPGIKKTKAKEAKDESLLFIITVGRFACWAPYWLYKAGVYVPIIINMFIFGNSVFNPFIYSGERNVSRRCPTVLQTNALQADVLSSISNILGLEITLVR